MNFDTTFAQETLLPLLISSLGSEELAKTVIENLKEAAKKKIQQENVQQITNFTNNLETKYENDQEKNDDNFNEKSRRSESVTSTKTTASTSSIISSLNSDKPFPINSRGRKRIYTDEERRLRKNYSSKRSRERHTEKVMENKEYLDILRERHSKLVMEKDKLIEQISDHRKTLCEQCLDIVDTALERIENGEDLIVLKCVNWCCANRNRTINLQPKLIIKTSEDFDEKTNIQKKELPSEIGENT